MNQKGSISILAVILLLLLIGSYLVYSNKNLFQKPTSTQLTQQTQPISKKVNPKQESSLDDEISYTIPSGWKKEYVLSFVSSDFREEGLPTIADGARITIKKSKRDPVKTLVEQVTPNYLYGTWNVATSSATFNSKHFTNIFACGGEFGFCHDTYSIENNGDIWTLSIICNENCDTKAGVDSTIYAKDRDAFLDSIKFK